MNYSSKHLKSMYIVMVTVTIIAVMVIIATLVSGSSKIAEPENTVEPQMKITSDNSQQTILALQDELQQKDLELTVKQRDLEAKEKELQTKEEQISDLETYMDDLSGQAAALENTLKRILSAGKVKPVHYNLPKAVTENAYDANMRDGASLVPGMTYEGEWEMTVYTASIPECASSQGKTASGEYVTPGYSIAVDNHYWKFGTKFYIEGIGIVQANDTGGAIKGKNRLDLCIMDRDLAYAFGRKQVKVWVIND